MTKNITHKLIGIILIIATALNISCERHPIMERNRQQTLILFSLGFNNLSNALKSDLEDLVKHSLSKNHQNYNLLVLSHHTIGGSVYTTPTSPILTHIYKDEMGVTVRDTVLIMDKGTIATSAESIRTVLEFAKENFPAEKYGMIISSHGTGWAPENYCNEPDKFDHVPEYDIWKTAGKDHIIPAPLMDGTPEVKSIGVHNVSKSEIVEIDITDLADAIPMKMDYIIFDACFMGGIEVAYELRNCCDRMVFSQTEILSDGMDYKTMLSYLFNPSGADLEGFCENYYQYYNNGPDKSATISLVDCNRLEPLALACREIFEKYREKVDTLEKDTQAIQKYFRSGYAKYHAWFYDLESIISNCGVTKDEQDFINTSLRYCVKYKAATEKFLGSIELKHHSGLSMYIPYESRTYLNSFYKTLEWNKTTGLVK